MSTVIHWFRRDLRLRDNPALAAAQQASGGQVIPLFILDDAILAAARTGPARVAFMLDSLRALDRALRACGSRLVLRRGSPLPVLRELLALSGAAGVYWNRDYTPFARRRDALVAEHLAAAGCAVVTCKDAVICEANAIRTQAGTPYTVYTPYLRQWRARVAEQGDRLLAELPPARLLPVPDALDDRPVPDAEDLGVEPAQLLPPGGEAAGLARLADFAGPGGGIGGYAAQRDLPGLPGTSRLSPYLRLGCVAPRACLRAALAAARSGDEPARRSADVWIGELAWRDFYYQILFHFPHVLRGAFRPQYDALAWENDPALFAAWCEGRTGYPIVDAAMRQLRREAWMHNRARMIVASFLTKDLLVDWRWGERFFMQSLVDGDHAANNGGWQWAAGTGTDAQPYFRIFNPISQGQRFDPQGAYVRRYVPELAGVPDRYIHAPWTMPPAEQRRAGAQIGRDYPAPVVDHAARRQRALALYKAHRD